LFFDYIVQQWLKDDEIPVVLWSCYYRLHRTDDAVEGCNNKVNSYFERTHPNIKQVLGCLQKEAENCNHLYENDNKFSGGKIKKCYINLT
jgi:hypothetical protein